MKTKSKTKSKGNSPKSFTAQLQKMETLVGHINVPVRSEASILGLEKILEVSQKRCITAESSVQHLLKQYKILEEEYHRLYKRTQGTIEKCFRVEVQEVRRDSHFRPTLHVGVDIDTTYLEHVYDKGMASQIFEHLGHDAGARVTHALRDKYQALTKGTSGVCDPSKGVAKWEKYSAMNTPLSEKKEGAVHAESDQEKVQGTA